MAHRSFCSHMEHPNLIWTCLGNEAPTPRRWNPRRSHSTLRYFLFHKQAQDQGFLKKQLEFVSQLLR